jgi:hypothetical protein
MSEAEVTPPEDRLPWLGEEAEPPQDHRTRDAIGLAIVAALLIFGVSYWIASQSWQRGHAEQEAVAPPVAAPLPNTPARQQAAVKPRHHRKASTSPVNERAVAQRAPTRPKQEVAINKAPKPVAKVQPEKPVAVAQNAAPKAAKPLAAAPKVQVATLLSNEVGTSRRLVRIGAFTSPVQAKVGWRQMVRAYPALAHLPAVVVDASGSRAQPVYRFQIATASQANSDILCQRMARIELSCGAVTR